MKSRGKKLSEGKKSQKIFGIPTSQTVWVMVVVCFMSGFLLMSQAASAPVINNQEPIGSWSDTFEDNFGIETTSNITIANGGTKILQPIVGTDWTKLAMAMNVGQPGDYDDSGIRKGTVLRDYDHTYKMWYTGYDGYNWRILYAESQDGINWARFGVAIDLGEPEDPDSGNALWPTVIKDKDAPPSESYKMWYSGYDGVHIRILYATSPDGINWTKHGIVMNEGLQGEFDADGLYVSSIIKDKNGIYNMWYHGLASVKRIQYATSSDGKIWNKEGVVLDIGSTGSLESDSVFSPSVILDECNIFHMWYTGSDGTFDRIFYASSFDGKSWFKQGLAVGVGPFGSYDSSSALESTVLKDWDGFYKMWYIGSDGNNNRMMAASLPLSSIEDYHFDFSESDEGFSSEIDYPNSEIHWDATNENIYIEADRQDAGDELFTRPLPRVLSSDSDSWTLTARWTPIEKGNWNAVYPLFISGSDDDTIYYCENTIAIYYGSGDQYFGIRYPPSYHIWFNGGDGKTYVHEHFNTSSEREHSFYISYDAQSMTLTIEVRNFFDISIISTSYIIGTNFGDAFTFNKIGVATQGFDIEWEPETIGWTDDINLDISENSGILISESISLPTRGTWSSVSVDKTEMGSDNLIHISILDAETNQVIPGFENLKGTNFDISSIDPIVHPAIKLKATFEWGASQTPVLNGWKATWLNDLSGAVEQITPNDPTQNYLWSGYGFAFAGVFVVTLLSLSFAGRTEVFKYRTIPIIFPLYSRLKKDELLDQDTRSLIYQYIISNPGDNFNRIKEKLNLNNGTLTYHLQTLEREEYIKSMRDGIYKRFYPVEVKVQRVNGFGVRSVQGQVIMHLINNPGLTQKEICTALGISQQVVSYHLKLMKETGHVRAKRQGKTNRYFVNEWVPRRNM
jgi:DNA-binding MarR family transcriptional regulator/predicted GH43/DUF377 family glycosyl hydrolase